VTPFLPDTNAFSVFFRRRDEGLLARFAAAFPQVRLSAIVLAELEYGAAKSGLARHRSRIEALTLSVPIEHSRLRTPPAMGDCGRYWSAVAG